MFASFLGAFSLISKILEFQEPNTTWIQTVDFLKENNLGNYFGF